MNRDKDLQDLVEDLFEENEDIEGIDRLCAKLLKRESKQIKGRKAFTETNRDRKRTKVKHRMEKEDGEY